MPTRQSIYIVDDDHGVRDSLALLLRLSGYAPQSFASGEEFLASVGRGPLPGVVLLDLRMPGIGGADVQAQLRARKLRNPVIILTAHGDATSARNALKAGAFDFVEKPIDDTLLLATIEAAAAADDAVHADADRRAALRQRTARLTPRELEVMRLVVAGRHNREIAMVLDISPRTVEVYKARMMEKLGAERLPDLVRLAVDIDRADD
ncbi:MAG: response regulator transcription factor [Casimicrobiaceae bacterium]